MKKIETFTIQPVDSADILTMTRIQILADRQMDVDLEHSDKFKRTIDGKTMARYDDVWAGHFNRFASNTNDPFAFALKAQVGKRLLGCIFGASAVNDKGQNVPCFEELFVHPNYWRQKIASTLLETATQTVREAGAKNAQLWVESNNERLHDFYTKSGWTRRANHAKSMIVNGRPAMAVLYDIKL